jgi:hypothetical protein
MPNAPSFYVNPILGKLLRNTYVAYDGYTQRNGIFLFASNMLYRGVDFILH